MISFKYVAEPFLRALKNEFGYPIDIGKLKQVLAWMENNYWQQDGTDSPRLYAVFKVLFLQKKEHEEKFKELFWRYILEGLLYVVASSGVANSEPKVAPKPKKTIEPVVPGGNRLNPTDEEKNKEDPLTLDKEPPDGEEEMNEMPGSGAKYLNLQLSPPAQAAPASSFSGQAASSRFLFSEDYLPLTYREMVQNWRTLRQRSDMITGRNLDVSATVLNIAKDGMLITPVFQKEPVNNEDLLLILADRRGSMTPFHHLTDRLIEAAIKEGGHKSAMVYYFYNYPGDYLYRKPSLMDPVPLAEVYSKVRHDHTNALIISDAGAARGNFNETRAKMTLKFLNGISNNNPSDADPYGGLHKRALFVTWLNPMPRHRWYGTTAAEIARHGNISMLSLSENGKEGMRQAVMALMGKT